MANNSFIDPIERGGVRPNSGSFERRDDYGRAIKFSRKWI